MLKHQLALKLKNYRPVRALHVKLFFCSADTDLNFRVCCVSMSSSIFRVLCVRSETSQKLTRISTESIFPRNSSNEGSAKICSTSKLIRFQLFSTKKDKFFKKQQLFFDLVEFLKPTYFWLRARRIKHQQWIS